MVRQDTPNATLALTKAAIMRIDKLQFTQIIDSAFMVYGISNDEMEAKQLELGVVLMSVSCLSCHNATLSGMFNQASAIVKSSGLFDVICDLPLTLLIVLK